MNTPLGGGEPVIERPVVTMNGVLLTAVAATSTGDFTVVFLGTSKGHLKKVNFEIHHTLDVLLQIDADASEENKENAQEVNYL